MSEKTCCVTGHRDIPAEQTEYVKKSLLCEIDKAIADGYTKFISGFAQGTDQYFVEIVSEKKKENPDLQLLAAIPYKGRMLSLIKNEKTRILLEECAEIKVMMEEYRPSVYWFRNLYMVKRSKRVIAVYDGRKRGGTYRTMCYANEMERELRLIPVEAQNAKPEK